MAREGERVARVTRAWAIAGNFPAQGRKRKWLVYDDTVRGTRRGAIAAYGEADFRAHAAQGRARVLKVTVREGWDR